MNTMLAALAAVLVAATAFAPGADAAGGVRLGFGGPLGTFTATPSKGAASRNLHAERKRETARKRRAATAVREAARKPGSPAPRASRAERAQSQPKRSDMSRTEIATAVIATEEPVPLTGGSTLIQSAVPDTETDGTTEQLATDAPADTPAARAATVEAEETAGDAAQGSATCARFIPAVGMTVTVGCDD